MKNSVVPVLLHTMVFGVMIAGTNAILSRGIENDLTEATFWGQAFVTVTDKHPAGFGLVHYFWSVLFSYNEFAVLMLGVANLLLCVWLLWLVLKELDWPIETRAVPMCLALASLNSYYFLIKYNGNSAPAPFWLLSMWILLRMQKSASWYLWVLLGVTCAAAVFMKYQSSLFLLTIAGYTLSRSSTRLWLRSYGPYLAFGVFCLALSLHFVEMVRYDYPGLAYGVQNVTTSDLNPIVSRIASPAKYVLLQIVFALPGLAIALWWLRRRQASFHLSADTRNFLFWFGFIFPLSPCLVGLITGGEIGDIWGVGAAFLIVPFVLSRASAHSGQKNVAKIAHRTLLVTFSVFALLFVVGQPFQVHSNPKKKVAIAVEEELRTEGYAAPQFVLGRSHSGLSLNFYMKAHPQTVRGGTWDAQPWTAKMVKPGDAVLIEVKDPINIEDVARENLVRPVHEFSVTIPAVTRGLSKHKGFDGTFVYGYFEP